MFSDEEKKFYHRHLILPGFGPDSQKRLKEAKVLVIGAGGLGAPILQYLAAAGVGHLIVADPDNVDASNLHRQVIFTQRDVGLPKAEVAAERLAELNPYIRIEPRVKAIDRSNALEWIGGVDVVVDGSDNFPTRYLVADACTITRTPLVYGSIFTFEGQVSVFNLGEGPTLRCLFPQPPAPDSVPNCADIGVLGVLPAVVGSLQATEAIKILTRIGEPLSGKLLTYDARTAGFQTLRFAADPENLTRTELEDDYEAFCGLAKTEDIQSIEAPKLADWLAKADAPYLLDVREEDEWEIAKIEGAHLIPLTQFSNYMGRIPKDRPIVAYCHHGMRSQRALQFLRDQGFENPLYNLTGGIHAWSREVDSAVETY